MFSRPEKKGHRYHKTGTGMEPPVTSKTGKTKEHLAERTTHRTKNNWQDLERGKKTARDRKKWKETVVVLCSPIGRSGLSQGSQCQRFAGCSNLSSNRPMS